MAFEVLQIFLTDTTAAKRRDVPYAANTVGSPLDFGGGSSGVLAWASDDDRRGWARIDGSYYAYYELEVLNATTIRVYRTNLLGDSATEDVTVTAGATVTTLVHGVSVPLAGTLTAGHKARVYPAIFVLYSNTFYLVRGTAGSSIKLAIYNPSADTAHYLASLRVGRASWFENTSGTAIAGIHTTLDTVVADTYAVTVEDGSVSGKKFTFTGALNTYSRDNVAAAATNVPIDDSATTGMTFDAGAAPGNTDTASVYVSDLADGLQLAPDNAGTPGTWVSWNASTGLSIPLNVAGESDQYIPASQTVYAWIRYNGDASHVIGRKVAKLYPRSHEA